ncbi:MAG: light-harvesting antenna LH1, beta subunit [Gammaproteobacteria bacterium]
MASARQTSSPVSGLKGGDEVREFRRLYAVCFIIFLMVASVARILAWRWQPWPPGPGGYLSVVDEAKRAAHTFLPFAFMG